MQQKLLKFLWIVTLLWGLGSSLQASPLAEAGVIDLRDWEFESQASLELNGEWEFFWGRFVEPDQIAQAEGSIFMGVPFNWSESGEQGITPKGAATYHLSVHLPEKTPELALVLKQIHTAYTLFVNGEPIFQVGRPSLVEETGEPMTGHHTILLPQHRGKLDLVLQVSNYHRVKSGLRYKVELGLAEDLLAQEKLRKTVELLLVGGLSLMTLFFISLFSLRSKDMSQFYFGLFCLIIDLRLMFTNSRVIVGVFVDPSWDTIFRIAYGSYFIGSGVFALYLYSLYPKEFTKRAMIVILSISGLAALILLASDSFFGSRLVPWQGAFTMTVMVYVLWVFYQAWQNRRPGALVGLIGTIVLFGAIGNDILYGMGLWQTGYLVHYYFLVFLLSQAVVLGLRMDEAYFRLEDLSKEVSQRDKALSRLRSEVLTHSRHDLQTPLQSIMGISESLLENHASPSVKQALQKIYLSSFRLKALVTDILDVINEEGKGLEFNPVPLNLNAQLESCFHQLRLFDPNNPVTLEAETEEELPLVLADELRLQQVLATLVGNSLKNKSHGLVKVRLKRQDPCLRIEVVDEGGIPKEQIQELFESTEQEGGANFRLSITKALVEAMGGQMGVGSSFEDGSFYWVELPIAKASEAAQDSQVLLGMDRNDPSPSPLAESEEALEGDFKILVVDDEKAHYLMIEQLLKGPHYELSYAGNGMIAMDLIEEEEPDLILLDLIMPWMSGYEVLSKVREYYPMERLPILVITGLAGLEERVRAFELGANEVLVKPYHNKELQHKVISLLQVRKAARMSEELSRFRGLQEDMLTAKSRLNQLIEHSMNGLLFVDEGLCITYLNGAAAGLLGGKVEGLKGALLPELVQEEVELSPNLEMSLTTLEGRELNFSFVRIDEGERVTWVAILSESILIRASDLKTDSSANQEERQVDDLQGLVRDILQMSQMEGRSLIECMQEMEKSLDEVAEDVRKQEVRKAMVEVMQLSVLLWEQCTGTTKIDLAEQSGIWKAYLDRGAFRTRTLDKYLNLEHLPNKPRWKDVAKTAEFVLARKELSAQEFEELRMALDRFLVLQGT